MDLLAPKQLEFIRDSTKKINLAHGSVRSSKTVGVTFRVMQAVGQCPDSQVWFIGHTSSTVYDNIIRLILEPRPPGTPDPLSIFRPFCNWRDGARELLFRDKTISTLGAKDAGAIGSIQGKTMSICYCDEMTLFPDSIIDMISTRLSNPHSMLFATMNPSHPSHKLKGWIDKATAGDSNYYQLHFTLEDNPYIEEDYKERIKNSLSGVYYKRLYLGEWSLAEGSIFDFFDKSLYVIERPPCSAHYWIVGIDYGTNNPFAAVLVGVSTGIPGIKSSSRMWVEDEYYWDHKATGYQKTNSEFARDLKNWLEPYSIKAMYVDPSAAAFKVELQRLGIHPVNANNDVENGIQKMISEMKRGALLILPRCKNLIREIESYVWDPKQAERGYDEPLKKDDHCVDALRYAVHSHKVSNFDQESHNKSIVDYSRMRYFMHGRNH